MRIGELSKRSGVSASRIRFYEKHDVLPPARRGENGYREYPEATLKMLSILDDSQRLGFSLSEIRRGLGEAAPHFPSRASIVKALHKKLDDIDRHLNDVKRRRREIIRLLDEMKSEKS